MKNVSDTSFKEGKIEGIIEGELEKAKEIARNSLAIGLPIETIAQITGLSLIEIENLNFATWTASNKKGGGSAFCGC